MGFALIALFDKDMLRFKIGDVESVTKKMPLVTRSMIPAVSPEVPT